MRIIQTLIICLLGVLAPPLLTGCRLGNKVEHLFVDDPSGFYQTEARRVSYCSKTTRETCGSPDLLSVPDHRDLIVTDPVYLGMSHADSKKGALINKDDLAVAKPRGIALTLQGSGHFTYTDSAETDLVGDGSCISKISDQGTGLAVKSPTPDMGGNPIAGNLQFSVRRIQSFRNCSAFFSQVRSCYDDSTKCGMPSDAENAALQDSFKNFFQNYVSNNLLAIEDLPDLTELSYSLSFE